MTTGFLASLVNRLEVEVTALIFSDALIFGFASYAIEANLNHSEIVHYLACLPKGAVII